MLDQYKDLFNGALGNWKEYPYSIHLKDGVDPYHNESYKVPHVYEATLKKEVE